MAITLPPQIAPAFARRAPIKVPPLPLTCRTAEVPNQSAIGPRTMPRGQIKTTEAIPNARAHLARGYVATRGIIRAIFLRRLNVGWLPPYPVTLRDPDPGNGTTGRPRVTPQLLLARLRLGSDPAAQPE